MGSMSKKFYVQKRWPLPSFPVEQVELSEVARVRVKRIEVKALSSGSSPTCRTQAPSDHSDSYRRLPEASSTTTLASHPFVGGISFDACTTSSFNRDVDKSSTDASKATSSLISGEGGNASGLIE